MQQKNIDRGGKRSRERRRKTRAAILRRFGRARAVPTAHPAALRAYARPKAPQNARLAALSRYLIVPPPLPPAPSPRPVGAWGGGVSPLSRAPPPPRRFFRATTRAEMRRPDRRLGGAAWRLAARPRRAAAAKRAPFT